MLETASYFFKYLLPLVFSLLTVFILALLNHVAGPVLWRERIADPMEVLAYSILFVGPIAFALFFIFYFYGLELLNEPWLYAKVVFICVIVLIGVGLSCDLIFLPKIK